MHYFYITGTSRGLGKALAEQLLENPNHRVIGISRKQSIEASNYEHYALDLADLTAVQSFEFKPHADATRIVLINNAGMLGEVNHIGRVADKMIIDTYNVNLVSPAILSNKFAQCYQTLAAKKVVVNVSSGAGKKSIDGWSTYCSTKAGLDLFSATMQLEQTLNKKSPIRVISIAPGIVDTEMQAQIRTSDAADFSRIEDFIQYKSSGLLETAELVAAKYLHILNRLDEFEPICSVRDVELN